MSILAVEQRLSDMGTARHVDFACLGRPYGS
jgi:hypothetical protein